MILYYVRHGDPIYNPNQLTPLGERQAEAVAKRLAVYGIDRIYSSPSNRARQTAEPLCQIVKQQPVLLDWADENAAYEQMSMAEENGGRKWVFRHKEGRAVLNQQAVRDMNRNWHAHPYFAETTLGAGIERIQKETDGFLESLGYRHDLEANCYYALRENEERIAFFAHEGVGAAILSCMLDIPYPIFHLSEIRSIDKP